MLADDLQPHAFGRFDSRLNGAIHGVPRGGWLLMYVISGSGRIRYRGVEWPVRAGDLALIDRDDRIDGRSDGADDWSLCFVRFRTPDGWICPPIFERLAEGFHCVSIRHLPTRERIQEAFARLAADGLARHHLRVATLLRGMATQTDPSRVWRRREELMAGAVQEIFLVVAQSQAESMSLDARVASSLVRMEQDLAGSHSLASLADAANVSPTWLGHLFLRDLGTSPVRVLRRMRLQQAALRLKESDELIGAIAQQTGFGTIFYFSRQFRRHYGMSPRAYRQRHRT